MTNRNLWNLGDVAIHLGISKRAVLARIRRGTFPQPDIRTPPRQADLLHWDKTTIAQWKTGQTNKEKP